MRVAKALLGASGTILLLAVLVSTASARRLAVSSSSFRVSFARIRFESELSPGNNCIITLEGSLHSTTILKVAASLVGYITTARLAGCISGRATILSATLPWHLRYVSFAGILPNISRLTLDIISFSLRTRSLEAGCLLRTTAETALRLQLLRETRGAITEAEIEGSRIQTDCIIDLNNVIARAGNVTVLNGPNRVTITLI